MFKKILVPVDLSDTHQQALEIAAQLANEGGGQVTLLHVVEVIPGLWVEEERDFYDRIKRPRGIISPGLDDSSKKCMCLDARRSSLAIVPRRSSAMPWKWVLS